MTDPSRPSGSGTIIPPLEFRSLILPFTTQAMFKLGLLGTASVGTYAGAPPAKQPSTTTSSNVVARVYDLDNAFTVKGDADGAERPGDLVARPELPDVKETEEMKRRRLVNARAIEHPEDVFWLRQEELEQAVAELERGEPLSAIVVRIQERRAFLRAAKRVTPPPVLPPSRRKVMGFNVEGIVAADESSQTGDAIKGVGTSAGQVTAPASPESMD